ncbi:MAG: L-aspartate oxidase [Firmicutes bacterium]|nr:L-aspartate oxidase [Bacillota bacterium]
MQRYLFGGSLSDLPRYDCDVLIVGAGLAGLYTALQLDPAAAGSNMSKRDALRVLVDEAPENIHTLQKWGVPFDLDEQGQLAVGQEGAHSRKRIIHCHGDATGFHMTSRIVELVKARENVRVDNNWALVDLVTDHQDAVAGVIALNSKVADDFRFYRARAVVLASGGIGQLFLHSTNARPATGDALAAALRAGAKTGDLEFIQFHPTALPEPDENGRCFLISEAVRGEGAILRSISGEPFMEKAHPLGNLASRDVVSQAIYRQMLADNSDYVYLDITHLPAEFLQSRFPMIYETCLQRGLDMAKDYLPVAPVQHYFMGGVDTDLMARTTLKNLFACGEVAHTGIYGANRLASNSLLECLVFGRRAAQAINNAPKTDLTDFDTLAATFARASAADAAKRAASLAANLQIAAADTTSAQDRQQIRHLMTRYCGILRDKDGLNTALHGLDAIYERREHQPIHDLIDLETAQMSVAARAIVNAAIHRRQSVGAHFRTDDHKSVGGTQPC